MKEKSISNFFYEHFVICTASLSGLLVLLYLWKGCTVSFSISGWIFILLNLIYIPLAFIFKKKLFSIFFLFYAAVLVFALAFDKTYLYNNFSALFMVCIVFMLQPELKIISLAVYFVSVCIAFALNEEMLCHFFIHIVRGLWFVEIVSYVLDEKFQRKKLVLFDDERMILEQLCNGKVYQKEVEGFSENTVYRKLKAARERNGNLTRDQLVERYRNERDAVTESLKFNG